MRLFVRNREKARMALVGLTFFVAVSIASAVSCGDACAARSKQQSLQTTFSSPEEAIAALVSAVKAHDLKALSAAFGPEGKQVLSSGDEVSDKEGRERFVRLYEEKNELKKESDDKAVLEVGAGSWPFPIPVVKVGNSWRFDVKAGKEEILARRIGKNELGAIQTCLAYVDAQREYASKDRNGDGLIEYAPKFLSEPGKKDGLYWDAGEGEEPSPMGPLVASAKMEGYAGKKAGAKPAPYHGYYYRILTAQGKSAPGGAYDYMVGRRMIGGFALVAYPARYGASGVMTFIVSHSGEVYERDLGGRTPSAARAVKKFDPDKSWRKVDPKFLTPAAKDGEI